MHRNGQLRMIWCLFGVFVLSFNNWKSVEACPYGFYGTGCFLWCSGNCRNNATCNSTTGLCDNGCIPDHTGPMCEEKISFDLSAAELAFVITGVLLVTIVIIVPTTLYYRSKYIGQHGGKLARNKFRRRPTLNKRGSIFLPSDTQVMMRNSRQTMSALNHQLITKEVEVNGLADLLRYDKINGYEELVAEFQTIPVGEQCHIPCTIAKLDRNINKNRTIVTLAYDHSRVKLEKKKSDYINANYISAEDGYKYIASQGPLENTVVDHWTMIWQERISVVVMLTNLTEDNKEKCCLYWPSKGKAFTEGPLSIAVMQEKVYAFYTLRKMKLVHKETKSSRLLFHFQFTKWTDSEIPYPSELIQFYRSVKRSHDAQSTILVHCSEGGGRSGIFIALDKLHMSGLRDGAVNVAKCLTEMCDQRMNMVENVEQYVLLYHTLKESFHRNVHLMRKEDISKTLQGENGKQGKDNTFRKEFCELMSARPIYDDSIKAKGHTNIHLNLMPNVLPVDEFRVALSSDDCNINDYYNAVFFTTPTEYNSLIAAQYPAEDTAGDLIRLLVEQRSSVVVTVHPLIELRSAVLWYPEESSTLTPYKIQRETTDHVTNEIQKATLLIENPTNNGVHRVHVHEIMSWSTKNIVPNDTKLILTVIKEACNSRTQEGGGPITVMSYDGASGCGVFIAVYNAMEQLRVDGVVDMFSIVHDIHVRRPEMITTMDEYEFCYRATAELMNDDYRIVEDTDRL